MLTSILVVNTSAFTLRNMPAIITVLSMVMWSRLWADNLLISLLMGVGVGVGVGLGLGLGPTRSWAEQDKDFVDYWTHSTSLLELPARLAQALLSVLLLHYLFGGHSHACTQIGG